MFNVFYITAFVVIFIIFFGIKSALYFFVPLFLAVYFYNLWTRYTRLNFLSNRGYVLLELVPAKDLTKRSIELFLGTINSPKKKIGVVETYWKGVMDEQISIEILSDNSELHFYIRTSNPEHIQEKLAAYSPNSKLLEVSDYSQKVVSGGIGVEFRNNLPIGNTSDLLTKGDVTWSQFILKPDSEESFACGVRVIYFPKDAQKFYNKKLVKSYRDRDYFLNNKSGFRVTPLELAELFDI